MNPGELVTSAVDTSVHSANLNVPAFLADPLEYLKLVTVGSLVGSVLLMADPY